MTFNGKIFQQIQGTAMGKQHAPPYANLVIAYLVIFKLYPKLELKYGKSCRDHIEQSLKLYLDDGFLILNESLISSKDLLDELNGMNKSIQFTMDTSKTEIPFLDVLVKLKQNLYSSNIFNVETDIYHKPTDSFNYFPFKSCAPSHIARNIPYNLARRIVRIVSNRDIRNNRYQELATRLKARGYPEKLIADSIKTARKLDRDKLLYGPKRAKKDHKENITLVIDHNPNLVDPSQRIKNFCKELAKMPAVISGHMKVPQIITARRQPPNLLRSLSLSKKRDHKTLDKVTKVFDFDKCKNSRCKFCTENVIPDPTYTTLNGTKLVRNEKMSCKTQDLIYCLVCDGCKKEYIGETGRTIAERTNLHRSQINIEKYRKLTVSKHVNSCGNGNKFKIFPFHKCSKGDHIYREEVEGRFRAIVRPDLH